MAVSTTLNGNVTSWAGTANTRLIDTGTMPFRFTLSREAGEALARVYGGTGGSAARSGVRGLTGEIEGELAVPVMGDFGSITYASGFAANAYGHEITLNAPATRFVGYGRTYAAHAPPAQFDWQGAYSCWHDDTTPVVDVSGASAAFTGKYQELGATDNTLAGNIFTTMLGVTSEQGQIPTVEYSFRGDGALTQSSTAAGIFPDGVVAAPVSGELVLQADDGQTFTFGAVWTSITLSVRTGSTVRVRIGFANTNDWSVG